MSYYVHRSKDDREGWIGPIRSERQAEREVAAWRSAGWAAEAHPSNSFIRRRVHDWQRAARRAQMQR